MSPALFKRLDLAAESILQARTFCEIIALPYSKSQRAMSIRLSRLTIGVLAAAAVLLMVGPAWAIYYGLGSSKDEWMLKYDVAVQAVDSNTLNVVFTLADEGRLKPIYSVDLVAFSEPDSQGGCSYLAKEAIVLKPTNDGKRSGQAQIRKELADRAMFRILTLTVNGQRQQYAAYYDIPLSKFLNKAPDATPPFTAKPARSTVNQ